MREYQGKKPVVMTVPKAFDHGCQSASFHLPWEGLRPCSLLEHLVGSVG